MMMLCILNACDFSACDRSCLRSDAFGRFHSFVPVKAQLLAYWRSGPDTMVDDRINLAMHLTKSYVYACVEGGHPGSFVVQIPQVMLVFSLTVPAISNASSETSKVRISSSSVFKVSMALIQSVFGSNSRFSRATSLQWLRARRRHSSYNHR